MAYCIIVPQKMQAFLQPQGYPKVFAQQKLLDTLEGAALNYLDRSWYHYSWHSQSKPAKERK